MSERLATGAQAWFLNTKGRLAIVDSAEPITAGVARELISAMKAEPESDSL